MPNYPWGEFCPCLQDRGEIRVGARFHLGWTCIQNDKFDQRQGQTHLSGEIHPELKSYM